MKATSRQFALRSPVRFYVMRLAPDLTRGVTVLCRVCPRSSWVLSSCQRLLAWSIGPAIDSGSTR
jgi:hypothetical protein